MKRLGLLILMISVLANPGHAADWTAEMSVKSGYSWRGLEINDGAVLQPAVSVSSNGWWMEVWGNMDLTDANDDQYHLNEIDLTLAHDWEFERYTVSAGAIWYTYPGSDDAGTTELFAGIFLDVPLQPALTLYRDVDEIEGTYLEFSLSHAFPLPGDRFTEGLLVTGMVGYGSSDFKNGYFMFGRPDTTPTLSHGNPGHQQVRSGPSSGLLDVACRLELPIRLNTGQLTLTVSYINIADSDIHSPGYETDDTRLVYGITWSVDF